MFLACLSGTNGQSSLLFVPLQDLKGRILIKGKRETSQLHKVDSFTNTVPGTEVRLEGGDQGRKEPLNIRKLELKAVSGPRQNH